MSNLPLTQLIGGIDPDGKLRAIAVGADGTLASGTDGAGGATSANQELEIAALELIGDRLPSALIGNRLPVDVQSLNVTVSNAQLEIANDSGNPIPVSGASLTSIDNKTPSLGANTTANSRPITIASDDAISSAIRDRLGNTAITGVTMPTGGIGLFGWLSGIWKLVSDRLPSNLVSDSFKTLGFGRYNATRPTFTDGTLGELQITTRGGLLTDHEDYISPSTNISTVDTVSTTTVGAFNQEIIRGNPSNNSFAQAFISGNSSFSIIIENQPIGSPFVGNLRIERSPDGQAWTAVGAFVAGSFLTPQIIPGETIVHGNCSAAQFIRLRAISWTSGIARIKILAGQGTGTITIGNPMELCDKVSQVRGTIKPASTLPLATDTAIVVTQRPGAIAPTLSNLTLIAANTEYSTTITAAKKISFKILSGGLVRYAYVTGRVAASSLPYYTLETNAEESEDFMQLAFTGTLFFGSATAGTIILIKQWN